MALLLQIAYAYRLSRLQRAFRIVLCMHIHAAIYARSWHI